jgi:hypothetical protein
VDSGWLVGWGFARFKLGCLVGWLGWLVGCLYDTDLVGCLAPCGRSMLANLAQALAALPWRALSLHMVRCFAAVISCMASHVGFTGRMWEV